MIEARMTSTTTQLWRAHAADLVRFATVLVGPADAHDIVVEAFLRGAARIELGAVDGSMLR